MARALCPLAIPMTVVLQGNFVSGGQSDGAKRLSGGRVWEGGREDFLTFMYENGIFLHIIVKVKISLIGFVDRVV